MVLVILIFGSLAALPFLASLGLGGWFLGKALPKPPAISILGGLIAGLAVFGGAVGGVVGGAKQLTWESYRSFPLRLRTLFTAELVAGVGDLIPLSVTLGLTALLGGVVAARPQTFPFALLSLLEGALATLVLQLVVSSLASALVRRLRLALFVLGIATWIGMSLVAMVPHETAGKASAVSEQRIEQIVVALRAASAAASVLPTTACARSLARVVDGHWGRALLDHAYPLGLLVILGAIAARLLAREAADAPDGGTATARLWSFSTPTRGVARLAWHTIMGSQFGRFGFIIPLVTVALIKGPLNQYLGRGSLAVPAAFTYLSLVANHLQLNQFGLDGHGAKTLLLLPVATRDVLQGKALALAVYQGIQAALLSGLLILLHRPRPAELVAGFFLGGCFFLAQSTVGRWTSAWMPRPVSRGSLRSSTTPLALVLLGLGLSVGGGILFGGTYAIAATWAPSALVPVMAALFGICFTVHRMLLPHAASYLHQQRGKVVEAMS
jgi:hypothetical protein